MVDETEFDIMEADDESRASGRNTSDQSMETPEGLRPVLARIHSQGCLGLSKWFEVVYYDDQYSGMWCCYSGSDTFKDGERVTKWAYADKCL